MKKLTLFLLFLGALKGDLLAQQDPRFTLFNYNYAILNPAAVGSKEKLSLVVLHRQQWTGYAGGNAPYTSTLSLDMPVFKLRSAMGLTLMSDHHGILQQNTIGYSYAVIAHTAEYGRLSMGLNVAINQNSLNFESIRTDPANANVTVDPNFNYGKNVTKYAPSLTWGVYYYDRVFKLGLSIPFFQSYSYYGVPSSGLKKPHVLLTTGINLILNDEINYNPRLLLKVTANAPLQVEVYNQFVFGKNLACGVSIRSGESVSGIVSYTFHPQFNMSYSYDLVVLNQLRTSQYGSHELGLNYVFPFPKYDHQQKVLHIKRKFDCIDFDHPKKKKFFKEVEDIFYDRN